MRELNENQYDSHSWVALGLQFVNEGSLVKAKTCFERAMMCGEAAFMPYREMVTIQCQELQATLLQALRRLNQHNEHWKEGGEALYGVLQKYFPPHPIVDTGGKFCTDLELPPFDYDMITVNENGDFILTSGDVNGG